MQQDKFVVEGEVAIGSYQYPIFVDDGFLGEALIEHFQPARVGDHYRVGRARITVELLEEE
jgi:hypothetical protein